MSKRKASKGKKHQINLSPTAVFFWSVAFVVVLAWIFVLGIFVGRDLIPENVKNLVTLKTPAETSVEKDPGEKSVPLEIINPVPKDSDFEFYDELTSIKEKKTREPKAATQAPQPPPRKEPQSSVPASGSGKYAVQVASLADGGKARRLTDSLIKQGYGAYTQKATVRGKTYYRVRCGKFETRDQAGALRNQLAEKEGLRGFVTSID
jgi:cell division septation protein DedD